MTNEKQRAPTARPQADIILQLLHETFETPTEVDTGEAENDEEVVLGSEVSGAQIGEWDEMRAQVEELTDRDVQHFDDQSDQSERKPTIVKAPPQPTKVEIEQHQSTHTPYASLCKHCVAARAIRRQHPTK